MPLQIRPVTRGGHAGPVTMGRITCGPLSWTRPHCGMTPSQAFVWCRIVRRVSPPVVSLSDQRLQRRPRAKGGVFAFAPTKTPQPDEPRAPPPEGEGALRSTTQRPLDTCTRSRSTPSLQETRHQQSGIASATINATATIEPASRRRCAKATTPSAGDATTVRRIEAPHPNH
jgi:hypothetical protein